MTSVAEYENLIASMNNANQGLDPAHVPPVLEDVINDKVLAAKGSLQGISGLLVGSAAQTGLKAALKSKGSKALENAGIKDEDIDALADAGAEDGLEGVGKSALSLGVKVVNRQLGNGIKRIADAGRQFGSRVRSAFQEAREISPDTFEFRDAFRPTSLPEGETDPFTVAPGESVFERATLSAQQGEAALRGDQTLARIGRIAETSFDDPAPRPEPAAPAPDDITPVQSGAAPEAAPELDAGAGVDTGEQTISKAGKVLGDLEKIGEAGDIESVATIDPVELGVTALLGAVGTIGSLFIKTHHIKNVVANVQEQVPVNYASQLI